MWKFIVFLTAYCIVCAKCRPAFEEFPYDSRYTRTDDNSINEDLFRQLNFFYKPSKRGENYELPMDLAEPVGTKRALSMLARWRPFNSMGKNRSSIREHNNILATKPLVTDYDIVSAETRALLRPVGQPLRWG